MRRRKAPPATRPGRSHGRRTRRRQPHRAGPPRSSTRHGTRPAPQWIRRPAFITTRRGAVGSTARARLSEARHAAMLDRAESGPHPVAALAAAERAHDPRRAGHGLGPRRHRARSFPSGHKRPDGRPRDHRRPRRLRHGCGRAAWAVPCSWHPARTACSVGRHGRLPYRPHQWRLCQSDGGAATPGAPPVQGRFGGPSTWMSTGKE